jgi:hypothetical protein
MLCFSSSSFNFLRNIAMHNNSWSAVLSATCVLAFASAVRADEITTVESTTTTPAGSSFTTRSTTEGDPANAELLSRRTLIVPTGGPIATNESSSSMSQTQGVGNPKYIKRVNALREQVNTAVNKGWLTDADATPYRSRLDNLLAKANAVDSSDSSSNALEKQINEVNIELSDRLAKH